MGYVLIVLLLTVPLAHAQQALLTNSSQADQSLSLDQLANLLANDKTRQQLIDELRQAAAQNKDHENESPPGEKDRLGQASKNSDADASQHTSFARQLAEATVAWSEKIGSVIATSWQDVAALAQGREEDRNIAWSAFFRSVTVFAIVAVSTGGAFLALRALAGLLFPGLRACPRVQLRDASCSYAVSLPSSPVFLSTLRSCSSPAGSAMSSASMA
ncbi:hypothetical protein [Halomonas sp. PR-M31]|uniref:hypothetical protein n=1 Tax=Halomonas sp. PR-M31 TaxID=1471202 RepID=UPI000ABBB4C9|nr:hypothetical protein [Halomonas sp. PR-M31]